jgi:hypothetical protein
MLRLIASLFICTHEELGWPRLATTGETYRVCAGCTREFKVDPKLYQIIDRKPAVFIPAPARMVHHVNA